MRQLQGDGRRLQRVRDADAHDERVHPAQPAVLPDNRRAAGNGEGDHGDEQGPVEDPDAAKVRGEVRGTAAVPFVAAQEGEVVFHRRGMRVVKFQPAVGDDDVPVRAHRRPLHVAAAALGAVVNEGGGERGLPVLDAVQGSLRVVVRFRPVALARFEVDAVGATRFRIDKVLETVTRVRGERVRQVDRLLYVREPVPFLAQRPLLDHVAPSLVRFVAEDEDVQRVLAALPALLGGGELQRQAALLGDAEPADELLGGDAVELDRAGLNLGERGRRDAREAREAPPERGSPGIRRHDQIKSDRRPEGAQGRASDRARVQISTRRGMDSTRTRTDGRFAARCGRLARQSGRPRGSNSSFDTNPSNCGQSGAGGHAETGAGWTGSCSSSGWLTSPSRPCRRSLGFPPAHRPSRGSCVTRGSARPSDPREERSSSERAPFATPSIATTNPNPIRPRLA